MYIHVLKFRRNLTFVFVDSEFVLCLGVRKGVGLAGVLPFTKGVLLLPPSRPGVRDPSGVPGGGILLRVGRIICSFSLCNFPLLV